MFGVTREKEKRKEKRHYPTNHVLGVRVRLTLRVQQHKRKEKKRKAPRPGLPSAVGEQTPANCFEPGIPKGPVFETGAIPDYAIVARVIILEPKYIIKSFPELRLRIKQYICFCIIIRNN